MKLNRILVVAAFILSCIITLHAQAPKSYTSSELLLQLKKLNTVGSVLYIAAHPDDENTRLIAYLANEKCLRTGYLSLTRGDGGQNLIGSEQGVELGVIRTQELLAARRIDGGEQFFTRAYDFGYSKNPEETFQKWNHDSILADVVWVIRNFRPDIIITRFATDGSGGHGHHTASAILAEEAFDAAADPNKFPEQLKYVSVWKTRRMFHNSTARFFNPNADLSHLIKLDVGGYNPLLGKSYGEISAESRSMHRSQGFGSAKQRGEILEYFKPIKGDTTGLKDIFEGMDFSWKRVEGGSKIGDVLAKTIKEYSVSNPEHAVPNLIKAHKEFLSLKPTMNERVFSRFRENFEQTILNTAGIFIEVTANKYQVVNMDDSIVLKTTVINLSGIDAECVVPPYMKLQKNVPFIHSDTLRQMARGYQYVSNPIQLEDSYTPNGLFEQPLLSRGYPEWPVKSNAVRLQINGLIIEQNPPIQYKWVDPSKGELYRPLTITTPLMMNMLNDVVAFSDNQMKEVKIQVKAGKDAVTCNLIFTLPEGWKIGTPDKLYDLTNKLEITNITLSKKGQEQLISLVVLPPNSETGAMLKVSTTVNGIAYTKGIKEIKYDHIPVQTLFPEAEIKLVRLDVQKKGKQIGYIPGAGDEVAPCLTQLGYEVVTLTDDILAKENLQEYDAIITGIRAYNTNDKMPSFKQKLMDYVNNGGNLIVQYNTNSFAGPLNSDIGPYKFKISRDRVTDENAKVTFELPDHPVLNTPNKITDTDFEGWIQERCIYSATETAPEYVMPLSMNDPGEKANKGSLIIAKHGKGNFIYTGLVFFRELPAGVPGAYRLMVNMIELGK